MKNIVVFFGGKSCEHDISIITATQVLNSIDSKKYNVFALYFDKLGGMYFGEKSIVLGIKDYQNFDKVLSPATMIDGRSGIYQLKKNKLKLILSDFVALLCFHGKNGEDGTIQSKLQLSNIAYTGSGVAESAICLDKVFTKLVLKQEIKMIDYQIMNRYEFDIDLDKAVDKLLLKIDLPVIIKPANLGSSIGIKCASTRDELIEGLIVAFSYDDKVLIEKLLKPIREINVSVMGYNEDIECSELEEPILASEILSFQDKYLGSTKTKGMVGERKIFPAVVSKKIKNTIIDYSKKAFKILNLSGICRIDYIIDKDENVYLNEINSIPGSLSFYLWENTYKFNELIDKLINIAVLKQKNLERNRTYFTSSVLTSQFQNIKK